MKNLYTRTLEFVAGPHSNEAGIIVMKIAIAIIFLWIGALKFVPYEADSITPFVAHSPLLSLFYAHPADYAAHLTKEGVTDRAGFADRKPHLCFLEGIGFG
jgi:reactive chlorine resistance protein C